MSNGLDPDQDRHSVGSDLVQGYQEQSLVCLCLTSYQQLRSYGDRPWLKVSSDRLVKPGIEPAIPGL